MRSEYVGEEIPRIDIEAPGALIANISLDRCDLEAVSANAGRRLAPDDRITFRDIALRKCNGSIRITGAILDCVSIDGWKGPAPVLHDCLFRHVRLSGRFKQLDISSLVWSSRLEDEIPLAYVDDNAERYEAVDWALDLSAATLSNCRVRGIPPELIRCDGLTQAVVPRESIPALDDLFTDTELVGTVGLAISEMRKTRSPRPDSLLWIEARSKHRETELELIARLYAHGLAIPQSANTPARAEPAADPRIEPAPILNRGDTAHKLMVVPPRPTRTTAGQGPAPQAPARRLSVDRGEKLEGSRFSQQRFEQLFVAGELGGDLSTRAVLRQVTFERCMIDKGLCAKALLDDLRLEDVETTHPTGFWAIQECALRHVVLAGLIGRVDIQPVGPTSGSMPPDILTWALDNDRIHGEVDWVLDVCDAELTSGRIQGLPGDKIRYDPTRQAVITPESMAGAADVFTAGSSDLVGWVGHVIRQALRGRLEQIRYEPLLWVDPRSIHRSAELQLIQRLHDHGLTLPSA